MRTNGDNSNIVNGFNTAELNHLIESLERAPESGTVSFKCRTHWQSGARAQHHFSQYRVDGLPHQAERRFTIHSDEPAIQGAGDTAPGPAELLLGALGGCITATINTFAVIEDIKLTGLQVDVTGELNLHGMFDIGSDVSKGIKAIRIRICINGSTTESRLRELAMKGFSQSPVRNSLSSRIAIEVGISAEGAIAAADEHQRPIAGPSDHIMNEPLNRTALTFMRSVGYRAGLFDAMKKLGHATAADIAREASLHPRYVKEWLGAMVTGNIAEYYPDGGLFRLNEPITGFTPGQPGVNTDPLAVVFAELEFDILKSFRDGSSLPIERLRPLYAELSQENLFQLYNDPEENLVQKVEGLHEKLQEGIDVLEVACGNGKSLIKLASLYPSSRFTGIDPSAEQVSLAIGHAREEELDNIIFDIKDLTYFHMTSPVEQYDFVYSINGFYAQWLNVVRGINLALKENGFAMMQDIAGAGDLEHDRQHPMGPLVYTVSFVQSMTVLPTHETEGLGARWGEKLTRDNFRKAGFTSVETKTVEHDRVNNWYLIRRSPVVLVRN